VKGGEEEKEIGTAGGRRRKEKGSF